MALNAPKGTKIFLILPPRSAFPGMPNIVGELAKEAGISHASAGSFATLVMDVGDHKAALTCYCKDVDEAARIGNIIRKALKAEGF